MRKKIIELGGEFHFGFRCVSLLTDADGDTVQKTITITVKGADDGVTIIPEDPEGKIHLLMSYTGVGRDVADPWYTDDFETAFQDILEGCEAMLM